MRCLWPATIACSFALSQQGDLRSILLHYNPTLHFNHKKRNITFRRATLNSHSRKFRDMTTVPLSSSVSWEQVDFLALWFTGLSTDRKKKISEPPPAAHSESESEWHFLWDFGGTQAQGLKEAELLGLVVFVLHLSEHAAHISPYFSDCTAGLHDVAMLIILLRTAAARTTFESQARTRFSISHPSTR